MKEAAGPSSIFVSGLNEIVEASIKRSQRKVRKEFSDKLDTHAHMMRKELEIIQEQIQTMNNNQTEWFLMLNNILKVVYENTEAIGTIVDELKGRVAGQEVSLDAKIQELKRQIIFEVKKREQHVECH